MTDIKLTRQEHILRQEPPQGSVNKRLTLTHIHHSSELDTHN